MTAEAVLSGSAPWAVIEGEALAALQSLPSASVGAVITDPPYSSGGFVRGDRMADASDKYTRGKVYAPTFGGDNRDQRSFAAWCVLWLSEAQRVTIPGGPLVQFSDWRQLPTTTDAIQGGGWLWRGIFVWSKGLGCRPAMGRFRSACEYAAWATNGPSLDLEAVGCLPGIIECPPPDGDERVHITQKPLAVMEAVCAIAPPGSVIIDPFCGSGTTGLAALRLGRRFIGIERDATYAAIARERLLAEQEGISFHDRQAGQMGLFPCASPS